MIPIHKSCFFTTQSC